MANKRLKANIEALDNHISKLMVELTTAVEAEDISELEARIEKATELRCKLTESKVSDSYSREIVSGLVSLTGMVLVLKHEKAEVITTKAFSMATKLFRGQ